MTDHFQQIYAKHADQYEAMVARARAESKEAYRDIERESLPSVLGKRSVNLQRGVHLRMARDRMRAQGWKV